MQNAQIPLSPLSPLTPLSPSTQSDTLRLLGMGIGMNKKQTVSMGLIMTQDEIDEYNELKELKISWEKEKNEYENDISKLKTQAKEQRQNFENRLINSIAEHTNVLNVVRSQLGKEFEEKEKELQNTIDLQHETIDKKDSIICDFEEKENEKIKTIELLQIKIRENESLIKQTIDSKIESLKQMDLLLKKLTPI